MDDVTRKRREIGQRMVRARVGKKLSIEAARAKVGEMVGETPSRFTWMRWETGRGPIPSEMVPVIARVVDADLVWLLTGRSTARQAAAA
jgi:hypothetical protein